MKVHFVTLLAVVLLIGLCQGQKLCTECNTNGTTTFNCNGQNCEAFLWPTNSIPYIDCKGPSSNCYYLDGYYSNNMYRFIACNYTLSGCGSCSNKNSCNNCYNGFVSYYSNIDEKYSSCKSCKDVIPGCLLCSGSSSCSQCESQYLNRGFCFEMDGVTIAGSSSQNSIQAGIEAGILIMAILSFLAFIMFAYGFKIWLKKQKYQPLSHQ